jgi:hypothetical protein
VPLWDIVEKYSRARPVTNGSVAQAHCMLVNFGYRYALRVCNTYCFSTATMVGRKLYIVKLHVHCLSFCFSVGLSESRTLCFRQLHLHHCTWYTCGSMSGGLMCSAVLCELKLHSWECSAMYERIYVGWSHFGLSFESTVAVYTLKDRKSDGPGIAGPHLGVELRIIPSQPSA